MGTVAALEAEQGLVPLLAVHVDHHETGDRPGGQPDVRGRPAAPPARDDTGVGARVVQAVLDEWALAARLDWEDRQVMERVNLGGTAEPAHVVTSA